MARGRKQDDADIGVSCFFSAQMNGRGREMASVWVASSRLLIGRRAAAGCGRPPRCAKAPPCEANTYPSSTFLSR